MEFLENRASTRNHLISQLIGTAPVKRLSPETATMDPLSETDRNYMNELFKQYKNCCKSEIQHGTDILLLPRYIESHITPRGLRPPIASSFTDDPAFTCDWESFLETCSTGMMERLYAKRTSVVSDLTIKAGEIRAKLLKDSMYNEFIKLDGIILNRLKKLEMDTINKKVYKYNRDKNDYLCGQIRKWPRYNHSSKIIKDTNNLYGGNNNTLSSVPSHTNPSMHPRNSSSPSILSTASTGSLNMGTSTIASNSITTSDSEASTTKKHTKPLYSTAVGGTRPKVRHSPHSGRMIYNSNLHNNKNYTHHSKKFVGNASSVNSITLNSHNNTICVPSDVTLVDLLVSVNGSLSSCGPTAKSDYLHTDNFHVGPVADVNPCGSACPSVNFVVPGGGISAGVSTVKNSLGFATTLSSGINNINMNDPSTSENINGASCHS
ncbi:uncharacterized protein LOC130291529 isoform X4 [Hyla sarda]|uniref:uncharacterized protein LOC130291529 isoform X4 n=1 Tax=Hyla sarda TaxID=327740 RepID=UPI0024C2B7D1|nr:uncharacterized protein LOC130291529 isoform X4 [Hyla sarda]XP_056396329.1 uncharacterized protein LOC130291529 isoform X4 [Hyla sarda]